MSTLDKVQLGLDTAGFIPGIGVVADVANAGVSLYRGKFVEAGLNLFAAIPGIGDAAAAMKIAGSAPFIVITKEALEQAAKKFKKAGEVVFADPRWAEVEKSLGHAPRTGKLRDRLGKPPGNLTKPQAHHDLPQAPRFKKYWERTGLDINDPAHGRWVEGGGVGNHQK